MNSHPPILTGCLILCIATGATAPAQAPPAAPAAPEPELTSAVAMQAQLQQQLEFQAQAQAQAEQELMQAEQAVLLARLAAEPGAPPELDAPVPVPPPEARVAGFWRRSSPRALIIRTGATDAKTQSSLEEDLSVMARILEKAAGRDSGSMPNPKILGIDLLYAGGGSNLRNLYLEGYGALFLLSVPFPLVAPPAKPDESRPPAAVNSDWEEAKRELYGRKDGWPGTVKWAKLHGGTDKPVPYDARKVERLQRDLLEAFKNAANIRNLKPEETVTVCVFGRAGARAGLSAADLSDDPSEKRVAEIGAVMIGDGAGSAASQQTVLTLRAKKADAESFAKGSLDLEAFTRRAQITTYATDAGGWGASPAMF